MILKTAFTLDERSCNEVSQYFGMSFMFLVANKQMLHILDR